MPRKKHATPTVPPAEGAPPVENAAFHANAAKVGKPARTGSTVTVGLKLPNGLVLQIQEQVTVNYPVMGGGMREAKEWRPNPEIKTITLFGSRAPFGEQPKCLVVGGFAMTPGIPKDFWETWLAQNKRLDLVVNGLIFAQDSADSARDDAKDRRATRSGMEPITPGNDPRTPKRKAKDGKLVDAIVTGDEQPAAA